ncbi:MAG: UDP-N-acetylglucosamine 2-epimerase (non-hydrolyzing) [Bacteroidia bacterium]|nr:UDP-N-acetylglucosamine 2-epimerase (non-hydrolyzing) [Bacteroidia bacterium]
MKKILHVVGARPNFMKLRPVYENLSKYTDMKQIIVHTGQHFDYNMSGVFFEQLGLPKPDINLEINGGTVLNQIGNGILKIEKVLSDFIPDLVCIYGDVNATSFTSIAASKLGFKIAHIEAGLRSFDKTMPEETNRIIADCLSDYLFTPSIDGDYNLTKEGKSPEQIFFVGNVMIDSLIELMPKSKIVKFKFDIPEIFALVTLHRPSNVDDYNNLLGIIIYLEEIGKECKIIFPIHPRTKAKIEFKLNSTFKNIIFVDPLSYLEFIFLEKNARFIITDSGGVQEESTFLGTPCFTLRDNTERPITVTKGTNILVGSDINKLKIQMDIFFKGLVKKGRIPDLWDGKAGSRIAKIISEIL